MLILTKEQPREVNVFPAREALVEQASVNWRAIFAGVFISLIAYFILTALGMAVGGTVLTGVIEGGTNAAPLGISSGIWLVLSTLISLYFGSYMASRVSGLAPGRIGSAQGMVIAAFFFIFMFSQLGTMIGGIGKGMGSTIGGLGGTVSDLSKDPRVQAVIEDRIADLNLQSSPDVVLQGLASRLVRGDAQGARNYLARQAGISPAEADRRISGFTQDFQSTLRDVGSTTAKVVTVAGWTLFGTLLLGTIFAVWGGKAGSRANLKRPISRSDREAVAKGKVA